MPKSNRLSGCLPIFCLVLCVSGSLCLPVCLSITLSLSLSLHLHMQSQVLSMGLVWPSLTICLYTRLPSCHSLCLSVPLVLCINEFPCLSVWLSICLSVFTISVCQFKMCLFVCLFDLSAAWPYVCLSNSVSVDRNMFLYMYVSLFIFHSVCHPPLCWSLCLSVYVCLSCLMTASLRLCLFIQLSVSLVSSDSCLCLSVQCLCLCLCQLVSVSRLRLFICLYVCMSFCLSLCSSACMPVCFSICLSVCV